jgi:hypothetical protein
VVVKDSIRHGITKLRKKSDALWLRGFEIFLAGGTREEAEAVFAEAKEKTCDIGKIEDDLDKINDDEEIGSDNIEEDDEDDVVEEEEDDEDEDDNDNDDDNDTDNKNKRAAESDDSEDLDNHSLKTIDDVDNLAEGTSVPTLNKKDVRKFFITEAEEGGQKVTLYPSYTLLKFYCRY